VEAQKHDEGFIVQEVVYRCDIVDCKDICKKPVKCPKEGKLIATYYEAWHVPADKPLTDLEVNDPLGPYTDHATARNDVDTCGAIKQTGTIKFFSINTTGDLRKDKHWKPRPQKPYGEGKCLIGTGDLPTFSQTTFLGKNRPPDFWNKPPLEDPKSRTFSDVFNCCDNVNQKDATAKPDVEKK
jgi:hypothetical protein